MTTTNCLVLPANLQRVAKDAHDLESDVMVGNVLGRDGLAKLCRLVEELAEAVGKESAENRIKWCNPDGIGAKNNRKDKSWKK